MHTTGVSADRDRPLQEVEAEWAALIVCDAAGIDTSQYGVPCITGRGSGASHLSVRTAIGASGDRARRAASEVINYLAAAAPSEDGLSLVLRAPRSIAR